MKLRVCSALLLLLSACVTTEPTPKVLNQLAVPIGPVVAPRPMVLPAPLGLSPPVPLVMNPEGQHPPPEIDWPDSPQASRSQPTSRQEPDTRPNAPTDKGPPPTLTSEHRSGCEPIPVPHRGGDAIHNECADRFPPNRYPGKDVLVGGKRFDALQVGVRVLWEIKTDQFETYSAFLQNQVAAKQVEQLREERDTAEACGYGFVVGVSSAAHKSALLYQEPFLEIVVTGCTR